MDRSVPFILIILATDMREREITGDIETWIEGEREEIIV